MENQNNCHQRNNAPGGPIERAQNLKHFIKEIAADDDFQCPERHRDKTHSKRPQLQLLEAH